MSRNQGILCEQFLPFEVNGSADLARSGVCQKPDNCYILIKQKLNDLRKLFQKNILHKNRKDEA